MILIYINSQFSQYFIFSLFVVIFIIIICTHSKKKKKKLKISCLLRSQNSSSIELYTWPRVPKFTLVFSAERISKFLSKESKEKVLISPNSNLMSRNFPKFQSSIFFSHVLCNVLCLFIFCLLSRYYYFLFDFK